MSDTYQDGSYQDGAFGRPSITYTVQLLIIINTIILIAQLLLDIPLGDDVVNNTPAGNVINEYVSFIAPNFLKGYVWTVVTYMFFHGSLSHLFFNMLWLFFMGSEVERVLGTRQFLWFYLLCGVVGVLTNFLPYILFDRYVVSVIGASGAIMGVIVAFAMIDPDRKLFLFPIPFPISARALVFVFLALNLLSAAQGGTGTSVATHLGGMATGYAFMKYRPRLSQWKLKRRKKGPKKGSVPKRKQDKMGKAIDNIFDFEDHERK